MCWWACQLRLTSQQSTIYHLTLQSLGAEHVLVGLSGDALVNEVKRLTGGEGAHVVYDSVGKATFQDSTRLLRVNGHLVSYGNASGKVGAGGPACSRLRAYLFFPYSSFLWQGKCRITSSWGAAWQGVARPACNSVRVAVGSVFAVPEGTVRARVRHSDTHTGLALHRGGC